MNQRPKIDEKTLKEYYYLKEELVAFCREHDLPGSGNKQELLDRIALFLETGEVTNVQKEKRKVVQIETIQEDSLIEENFVCSQKHRSFFKRKIGRKFTFNVAFQKWLKENAGKTYEEAIQAYDRILEEKKEKKSSIDPQFEYNMYIRDFFEENKGRTLQEAILCWKYKKSCKGTNRYEPSDLVVLEKCEKE